jgi:Amt family ammonium transporter
MLVTQIGAAAAALGWMTAEWIARGKPSALGLISGAVAGLVAITPASGFVGPGGAVAIGAAAGALCFGSVIVMKRMAKADDSLDCFGIHGVGGIVGAILTGVFAREGIGGVPGLIDGNPGQVLTQFYGIVVTIAYCAVASFILLKIVGAVTGGLRVSEDAEREGLDVALHGEAVP